MSQRIKTPPNCTRLGSGAFTRAFRHEDGDVILYSACNAKECMSLGWFPTHRLIPELRRVGTQTYCMRYLHKLPNKADLKPQAAEDLRVLRAVEREWCEYPCPVNRVSILEVLRECITKRGEHLTELLLECVDAMTSYTSQVGFECPRRNLRVDDDGNLIMLDCFFDQNQNLLHHRQGVLIEAEWDGTK